MSGLIDSDGGERVQPNLSPNLPEILWHYLHSMTLDGRALAYLRMNPSGVVEEAAGDLKRYGVAPDAVGREGETVAPFLVGLLPVAGRSATFRWLEVEPGVKADLHLFEAGGQMWVLLLDSTDEATRLQAFQQRGNQIALERDQLANRVRELEAELARCKVELSQKAGGAARHGT